MNFPKLAGIAACSLILAACGGSDSDSSSGSGDGSSSGGGNGNGSASSVAHQYYSLDASNKLATQSVNINHESNAGTITLGSDSITYSSHNGALTANGYTLNQLGDFSEPSGGVQVCKGSAGNLSSRHVVLPSSVERVADISVLKGKTFRWFEDCEDIGFYRFLASGGMEVEDAHADDEQEGLEQVEASVVSELFSSTGHAWTDTYDNGAVESGKIHAFLYRETTSGTYFFVQIEEFEEKLKSGAVTQFEDLAVFVQQDAL